VIVKAIRALFGAGLLVLGVLAFGVGYDLYSEFTMARRVQQAELARLRVRVAEQTRRMAQLAEMVDRLSSEQRVAVCQILSQKTDPDTGKTASTELMFQEVDADGLPIPSRPARRLTVKGDIVYVDALVIQFEEDLVAAGDETRGKTVYLFRRLFGEHQAPSQGFPLDEPDQIPAAYRPSGDLDPLIAELWRDFWKLSNDPDGCRRRGVKVMHGQAAYFKARYGNVYTLQIEADGGMNVRVARAH
jgi:hypothetical protein